MFAIQKHLCKWGLILENKVCCCFGHRDIWGSVPSLTDILEKIIVEENVTIFMTGGMGDFDGMFSSAVRTLKRKYADINLLLVKPYFSGELNTNKAYYEYMYDEVVIPDVVAGVHPKSAITKRNRWMVEKSDIILYYIQRDFGGAYTAIKYATKLGKKTISVLEK